MSVALGASVVGGAVVGYRLNTAVTRPMPFGAQPSTVGAVVTVVASLVARDAGFRETSRCAMAAAVGMAGASTVRYARPALLAGEQERGRLDGKTVKRGEVKRQPKPRKKPRTEIAAAFANALVSGGIAEADATTRAEEIIDRLAAAGFRIVRPKRSPRAGWIVESAVAKKVGPIFRWGLGASGPGVLRSLSEAGWTFVRRGQTAPSQATKNLAKQRSGLERRDLSGLAIDAPTPDYFPIPPGMAPAIADRMMGAKIKVG